MHKAYIGIGSNIGDRRENLEEAVSRLGLEKGIKVTARSSFYETRPAGGPPQENYLNGAVEIETSLSPENCLKLLKRTEEAMGRVPADRNHPRVIDLDILLYDDVVIRNEEIEIPHPRMHERHFVLKGFAEIAPETVHPVLGKTIKELLESKDEGDHDR
ncbi:MAG: 2-amino-4-hydroxy-6-hydroxymethyldihydropteridine diphosphokinase [Candidatus Omnitrophota bacterium]